MPVTFLAQIVALTSNVDGVKLKLALQELPSEDVGLLNSMLNKSLRVVISPE